jgi:hypothetical protein
MQWYKNRKLKKFLSISILTFLVLVIVSTGLPAFLLVLNVPSFELGDGSFQILSWQNTEDSTAISFNLLPLFVVAVLVGAFNILVCSWQPGRRN